MSGSIVFCKGISLKSIDMRTGTLTKTKWGIDKAYSEIGFRVKHLQITWVKGVFRDVNASIYTDGDDFLSADIEIRINADSVDTGDEERDTQLRSPDFFDAENYRHIVFISKNIGKTDVDDHYILHGTLSIKEIAIPVTLEAEYEGSVKDPWGDEKAGFRITGSVNRSDWNLNWNMPLENGGVLFSDKVKINCELQLIKSDTER